MILRFLATRRPAVLLALGMLLGSPNALDAHEIPQRAALIAFVKAEPGKLRIVLRAPLESMRDVIWPEKGLGYMDLPKSTPMAREAALLWIVDYIQVYENGKLLSGANLVATRISLPAERTFTTYESALAATTGAPVPATVDIPHAQALIDVVIEYPIASDSSRFSMVPQLARLGVQTTTVLRYITPSGAERAYQYNGDPGLVQLDPRWYHAAWQFVKLGVEHILGGIDHLLFVLCLVIPFRKLKPLIVIVTAFTVAHSITLASAALGVVPDALWFPPFIEVLIAGSILYMALENIVGASLNRRWMIAFGFGLVHGFGFSFALKESLQFAGSHLAVSLLTFNIGVEIGQVLVLVVAIPLLSLLFKRVVVERLGIIILSAFVAHTAWHWMTERGATLSEYSFVMPALDAVFAVSAMRAAIVLLIAGAAGWLLHEGIRLSFRGSEATEESAVRTADSSLRSE
jgi:hypothetical protein